MDARRRRHVSNKFMTKKNSLLIATMIVLAGVYVFFFTDWFKPKIIHISHVSRANHRRFRNQNAAESTTIPVTFNLSPRCRLTEIKVVPLAAWQTNHDVLPVWHLISNSNSVPVKLFVYGQRIRGLRPEVPGAHADPLQPDVTYRLFITAGAAKGEHDFKAVPATD
jgi:hypothetical protein